MISFLAWLYLNFVGKTSRVRWLNSEKEKKVVGENESFIYTFWHGRQVFFSWAYRNAPLSILVSQSKDGEVIADVIHRFGMGTLRGSSSRGGNRALVQLKKTLESGRTICLTPDGPRGPQREVALGTIFLAKKTGKPILPITYSAQWKMIFRSWDDYWVPLPFNSILINFGNPVWVSPQDSLEEKAVELANELNRITKEADQLCLFTLPHLLKEKFCYAIYNIGFFLFSPLILISIFLRYPRTFFTTFYKDLSERIGILTKLKSSNLNRSIWVHASSLGECRAAVPIVRALTDKYSNSLLPTLSPLSSLPLVFSSTTFSGVSEARKFRLSDTIFYSPIDFPFVLRKVFQKVRPQIILLLESEIWPNWLRIAKEFNIKIGIINGRLSQRSAERYSNLRWITEIFMEKIDFVCAREKEDMKRFEMIGIPKEKIKVTGNLKFDLPPWDLNGSSVPSEMESLFSKKEVVWVAGSIREGEEKFIFNSFITVRKKHPNLKLVFAPRHLENLGSIVRSLEGLNLTYAFKSQWSKQLERSHWDILLWDRFGDLWRAYQEAAIVFVGGSLVPKGGQNPIEPAWFSKPVLFGPSMENFAEPARMLVASGGAIQVQNSDELTSTIDELLSNPEKMNLIGANAKKTVANFSGTATKKTMEIVDQFINVLESSHPSTPYAL